MPAQKLNELKAVILVEIKSQFGITIIVASAPAAVVFVNMLRRSQHGDHSLFLLAQTYLFLIYDNLFQWYKSNVYFGHLKSNSRQTGSFVL